MLSQGILQKSVLKPSFARNTVNGLAKGVLPKGVAATGVPSSRLQLSQNVSKRFLATIDETKNTARQMPAASQPRRATPPSHDQATFTIRDGPIFHGKSFGAKRNISGEAVFTTSLVGYPESLTDPSYRGQVSFSVPKTRLVY